MASGLAMAYNVSEQISAFDNSALDDDEVNKLFQHLVDAGQVWVMEDRYRETAIALAEAGRIRLPNQPFEGDLF